MGTRPTALQAGKHIQPLWLTGFPEGIALGEARPGSMQLILFERGHWCPSCRRHLNQVADANGDFLSRSTELVAVTHEPHADLLSAALLACYPFAIGADPELEVSDSLGVAGIDEYGKRTIRPAALIVRPGGEIAFSYVGDQSIDRLSVPALLLAIDRLT